jgi:hypothetical protein
LHRTQSGEGNPVKKSRKLYQFVERVFAKTRLNGCGGRNIVQPPPEELAAARKILSVMFEGEKRMGGQESGIGN